MVLGILSTIRGAVGSVTKGVDPTRGAAASAAPKTLKESDFFTADIAIVAGTESIVGSYLIQPQDEMAVGYGSAQFPENQGTITMNFKDNAGTPVELEGEVRIVISDYRNRHSETVYEGSASDLRLGETDITKRIKLAMTNWFGGHNDKITVYFTPSTVGSGTLGYPETKFKIPCSVFPASGLRNL